MSDTKKKVHPWRVWVDRPVKEPYVPVDKYYDRDKEKIIPSTQRMGIKG